MSARVLVGDCREVLAELPPNSIDACVTDPPYGLEFMGKEWDRLGAEVVHEPASVGGFQDGNGGNPYSRSRIRFGESAKSMQAWHETWAREVYRVLKPGGHLLAFSGTRTSHRMVCAIEDAGFEIRDCLMWIYGSGFPKSLDVSKALDKAAGAEREVVGRATSWNRPDSVNGHTARMNVSPGEYDVTAPATDLAKAYAGYGTALKPAYEPIVLARKPLIGSVAANVTAYGTGGLNIDGTRIETDGRPYVVGHNGKEVGTLYEGGFGGSHAEGDTTLGRWPANLILDEEAAALLDAMSGERQGGASVLARRSDIGFHGNGGGTQAPERVNYGDTGGASRFFKTVTWSAEETCQNENTSVLNAAQGSTNMQATTEPIVPLNAQLSQQEGNDRPASSVETLFAFGETAIAPSPVKAERKTDHQSEHGPVSTCEHNEPTLKHSNALAADQDNTDTTLTTNDQNSLYGSAQVVMPGSIPIDGMATESDLVRWRYSAKASRAERNKGLLGMPERRKPQLAGAMKEGELDDVSARYLSQPMANVHPTVKPVDLMQWLVRLVTPKGGTVLDPFLGSGTTGIAADREGFDFIGIEQDETYAAIARKRIVGDCPLFTTLAAD